MIIQPWNKLSESEEQIGWRKILRRSFSLPTGEPGEFCVFGGLDSVSIFPVTTDNQIVLVRQFRPGPEKMLVELPAGGLMKPEIPIEGARRELLEETGYEGEIKHVTTTFTGAYTTEQRFIFVATNCVKIAEPTPDEYEFLETVLMDIEEFKCHLRTGQLSNSETGWFALDYLKML